MDESSQDPRIYLAVERTFLAWLRTGLALMGFGFVVARFGLFLREIAAAQPNAVVHSLGWSLYFGTVLVFAGVVVNVLAAWNHVHLIAQLNKGERIVQRPSGLGIFLALSLAAVGSAMAIYLLVIK